MPRSCTAEPVRISTGKIIPFRNTLWHIFRPNREGSRWTLLEVRDPKKIDPTAPSTSITRGELLRILASKSARNLTVKVEPDIISIPRNALRRIALPPRARFF